MRLVDGQELHVENRQPQAVGVFVHDDEVAREQRGHHRIGRNAERLEDEGAQQQHDRGDGEEAAGVVHGTGQRDAGEILAARLQGGRALFAEHQRVEPPHEAGDHRDEHQHGAEIEPVGDQQPDDARGHENG